MLEVDVEQQLGAFRLDIDMRAPSRGVTALFGRSGSGKTSLVNMLAGLTRPARGRIVIDDTVLFDSAVGTSVPPERRRLGYVFQEDRLFPHLSVRSNLLYGHRRAPARDRTTTVRRSSISWALAIFWTGGRPASRAARSSASPSAAPCSPIRACC